MQDSAGENQNKSMDDVRRAPAATFWDAFKKNGRVVNLRPPIYVRYPLFAIFGALALAVGFFAVQGTFSRGEVADFSPANCLGTWENPSQAAGEPETLAGEEFNEKNSAIFATTSAQIFCGGFLPQASGAKGIIKNVGITFVWQAVAGAASSSSGIEAASSSIGGSPTGTTAVSSSKEAAPAASSPSSEPAPTSSIKIPAGGIVLGASTSVSGSSSPAVSSPTSSVSGAGAAASSSQTSASDVSPTAPEASGSVSSSLGQSDAPPASPLPTDVSSSQSVSTPPADTSTSASAHPAQFFASLDSLFFSKAFAEEISTDTVSDVSDTSTVPLNSPSSSGASTSSAVSSATSTDRATDTVIVAPPIATPLSPIATSDDALPPPPPAATSTPALPPPPPDLNFLKVSYSMDGKNWVEIGKVNADNWQDFTVTLPVASWDDLAHIQIAIEGIPTAANPLPTMFLDGMFIEVHYDLPPDLGTANLAQVLTAGIGANLSSPASMPDFKGPNPFPDLPRAGAGGTSTVTIQKKDWRADEAPTLEFQFAALGAASGSANASSVSVSNPVSRAAATDISMANMASATAVLASSSQNMEVNASSTNARGTLTVSVTVDNSSGGSAAPSDFTVKVIAGNPAPTSTFPGDSSGTAVTIDADASYSVNISDQPEYAAARGGNCADSSGLLPGASAACTISETFTPPATPPPSSPAASSSSISQATDTAATTAAPPPDLIPSSATSTGS